MELTDLRETAALARLSLGKQELQALFPAFEQMIASFSAMEAADGDDTMPAVGSQADFVNAAAVPVSPGCLRPDTAREEKPVAEFMLSQAPERDGSFIVIPNVL
jgi:Asp-tRNA(Asn)/Glu-tRNA(Gln) amidotransferase C subunit